MSEPTYSTASYTSGNPLCSVNHGHYRVGNAAQGCIQLQFDTEQCDIFA